MDAVKKGAYDFIEKPFDNDDLLLKVKRAVEHSRLKGEIHQLKKRLGEGERPIIGSEGGLRMVMEQVNRVARTEATVFIHGESGTGKELVARAVHVRSKRSEKPFIAINCAALPENLLESELFGYVDGAFTGAKKGGRPGLFEFAHQGTLFLDEVEGMSLSMQVKLLRVLQEGEIMRVGGGSIIRVDVRIVAATNVNLTQAIAEGRFREDLYYRLNTVPIQIPPLRERGDDVLLLFRKFSADFAEKYRMPAIQLTEDAKKELLAYPWPGNVRQLKNITEQISIIETNREITAAILQTYLPAQNVQRLPALLGTRESKSFESEREILYSVLFDMRQEVAELRKMVHNMMAERAGQVAQMGQVGQVVATPVVTTANQPSVPAIIHPMQQATVCPKDDDDDIQDTEEYVEENLALDEVEKEMIRKALEKHHGKRKGAARDLKISERTLYRKIKEYELD